MISIKEFCSLVRGPPFKLEIIEDWVDMLTHWREIRYKAHALYIELINQVLPSTRLRLCPWTSNRLGKFHSQGDRHPSHATDYG